MLSYEQIKELIELVSRHRLGSFELERSGFRIRIDGQPTPGLGPTLAARSAEEAATGAAGSVLGPSEPPPAGGSPPRLDSEPAPVSPPPVAAAAAHVITSPIVGTFYAAPAQDAEPFVRLGERVRKGQILCIVEAMKLMNEIECDIDGVVVDIFPRNAQPVEFGEPLFAIRTG